MRIKPLSLAVLLSCSLTFAAQASQEDVPLLDNTQSAQLIRSTYEQELFTFPAFKEGHFGLRMYRQTLDEKYHAAIWTDMAQVASRLNQFANEVVEPEDIILYSSQRLTTYQEKETERGQLLRHAIDHQFKVSLDYQDESGQVTERKIQPLGQFFWGKVWTLVAWCELRDDYRQFRLDRIQTLRMHDEEFQSAETKSLKHYIAQYESKD